jgi:iron complex outermembrane receptor protein
MKTISSAGGLLTFVAVCSMPALVHAGDGIGEEKPAPSSGGGSSERVAALVAAEGEVSKADAPEGKQLASGRKRPAALEEVIVTARKRTELLQDIPVSVGVVSADDIDRRGLVSSEDYLRNIPGVNQVEGGSQGQGIIIRGLETQTTTQNITSGPTVATYFGETPTSTTAGVTASTAIDLKLVDIERVEVLRGPQGTAFGSSSLTGAVRTIPVAPKLDGFEGKLGAGYSATSGTGGDDYNFQGIANVPLIQDKLAVRAVAYRFEESGFYQNRAGSDASYQAQVAAFGAQAFAIDQDEVGSAEYTGGRLSALYQPIDNLKITLSYLAQKTETDGFSGANSGVYTQTILQVAPEHRRRGETGVLFDTDIDIANAMVEYNLGWASLLGTYSYTKSTSDGPFGFTVFGPDIRAVPFSAGFHNDHRADVGEVRLATQLDGPWNALVGLYYEDLRDQGGEQYVWYGDPELNFLTPGETDLGEFLDRRTTKQKAAFGEVSWEFIKDFTLTGGVRTYDYDRNYRNDAGDGALYPPEGTHLVADTSASGETFRANVSYKLGDGLVYAGWSQGFRLGRPQLAPPTGSCDVDGNGIVDGTNVTLESLQSVNSDSVDNYELGGKFSLFDRRVSIDAAVFRMKWYDIPFNALPDNLITTECRTAIQITNAGTVANIGAARSDGVEAQVNLQVTESLRVDVGGSWIDAKLTDAAPAQGYVAGQQLPGAPEYNANVGLQYEFDIASHAASVRADAIYVGSFISGLVSPSLPVDAVEAGDYVKVDLSARATFGGFDLDLFVRNLTNEDAFTSRWFGFPNDPFYGMRMRPRTVGLQLSYAF